MSKGKILEYITNLENQNELLQDNIYKLQERIDKATEELFKLKDMISKPETREENFPIQRKISAIIKMINGKGSDNNE